MAKKLWVKNLLPHGHDDGGRSSLSQSAYDDGQCNLVEMSGYKKDVPCESRFLIIPEDVPAGLAAVYGFAQPLHKGNDHRIGFGFRFGNHADIQILYELGPQTEARPLQSTKTRSAPYSQRFVRRRPILGLLLRAGFLRDRSFEDNHIHDSNDEPR